MYCSNCGKEIYKNNKFCAFCGHKVNDESMLHETLQTNSNNVEKFTEGMIKGLAFLKKRVMEEVQQFKQTTDNSILDNADKASEDVKVESGNCNVNNDNTDDKEKSIVQPTVIRTIRDENLYYASEYYKLTGKSYYEVMGDKGLFGEYCIEQYLKGTLFDKTFPYDYKILFNVVNGKYFPAKNGN